MLSFFGIKPLTKDKRKKKNVEKWYADNAENTLRYNYDLNEKSLVIDLGGYEGTWTDKIFSKYQPEIHIYEPTSSYFSLLSEKYNTNNKIYPYHYGLAGKTERTSISLNKESSSIYEKDLETESINIKSFKEEFDNQNWDIIDLIKINIEGGEYDLLENMIEHNLHKKCHNLQIQFHNFIPDCDHRRNTIRQKLRETHRETYNYEYVWENWCLKRK
jgi:FkbM family methyltransferase